MIAATTAVCLNGEWSCGVAPPCAVVATQPCGSTLCYAGGEYCAAEPDGGGTCAPYATTCAQDALDGCACAAVDLPGCACTATDAGVTVLCGTDGEASDAAASD